jgi:hypothetical protein
MSLEQDFARNSSNSTYSTNASDIEDAYLPLEYYSFDNNTLNEVLNGTYTYDPEDLPPNLEQCPAATSVTRPFREQTFDWRGWFKEVPFRNTRAIRISHGWPKRFGNPSNITLLWQRDQPDDGVDYIMGIAASAIFIFCLFCVWLMILLILKYFGPKRVGFWSGKFPELPESPSMEEEVGEEENNNDDNNGNIMKNQMEEQQNYGQLPEEEQANANKESTYWKEQANEDDPEKTVNDQVEHEQDVRIDEKVVLGTFFIFEEQPPHLLTREKENEISSTNVDIPAVDNDPPPNLPQNDIAAVSFVRDIQNPFALFDPWLLHNCHEQWAKEQEQQQKQEQQVEDTNCVVAKYDKDAPRDSEVWHDVENRLSIQIPSSNMPDRSDDNHDLAVLQESSNQVIEKDGFVSDKLSPETAPISLPHIKDDEEQDTDEGFDSQQHQVQPKAINSVATTMASIYFSAREQASENFVATVENKAVGDVPTDDQQLQKRYIAYCHQRVQWRWSRFLVIFSGLCIIVSSILMAISGVDSLLKTAQQSILLLQEVDGLAAKGIFMVDAIIQVVGTAENHTANIQESSPIYELLSTTNGMICGGVAVEQVCEVWAASSGVVSAQQCLNQWGTIQQLVRSALQNLFSIANGGIQSFLAEVEGVHQDLVSLQDFIQDVERRVTNYQWALYVARVVSVMLALLCFLMLFGIFCHKWPRLTRCLQSCITIPLFCFMVLLSFIITLVCMLSSTALADFCINGPDDNVLSILELMQGDMTEMMYDFAVYYINQCPPEYVTMRDHFLLPGHTNNRACTHRHLYDPFV